LIDEVYSHHELVRFQKHQLDAAWLEKIGDRYTKLQDPAPEFRSNRHSNAAMIFQDLCVLKYLCEQVAQITIIAAEERVEREECYNRSLAFESLAVQITARR